MNGIQRQRYPRWVVPLLMSVALAILNAIAAWSGDKGDPDKGKPRYEQYCAVCHGPRGLGDGPMAKATTPPASRLSSPEVRSKSDQELLKIIADGKDATMPAWRGLLSDQELLDVLAYVRKLGS